MGIARLGQNAAVVFGTSGFEAAIDIESMSFGGFTANAIDAAHLGVVPEGADEIGNRPYIVSRLVDAGEVSFECHYDMNTKIPVGGFGELITITWPIFTPTGTTPGAWSFQGTIISASPAVPLEDKITCSVTLRILGAVTIVKEGTP